MNKAHSKHWGVSIASFVLILPLHFCLIWLPSHCREFKFLQRSHPEHDSCSKTSVTFPETWHAWSNLRFPGSLGQSDVRPASQLKGGNRSVRKHRWPWRSSLGMESPPLLHQYLSDRWNQIHWTRNDSSMVCGLIRAVASPQRSGWQQKMWGECDNIPTQHTAEEHGKLVSRAALSIWMRSTSESLKLLFFFRSVTESMLRVTLRYTIQHNAAFGFPAMQKIWSTERNHCIS